MHAFGDGFELAAENTDGELGVERVDEKIDLRYRKRVLEGAEVAPVLVVVLHVPLPKLNHLVLLFLHILELHLLLIILLSIKCSDLPVHVILPFNVAPPHPCVSFRNLQVVAGN